jgi:hypothetical protein
LSATFPSVLNDRAVPSGYWRYLGMESCAGVMALAQSMVEYAEDLVTASPKESFTKIEVLILLNAVKNDSDLFATLDLYTSQIS